MGAAGNNIFIHGFGIRGFRSFSDEEQLLGPFKRVNVLIGENNSGKSSVLRFIRKVYAPLADGERRRDGAIDRPRRGPSLDEVKMLVPVNHDVIAKCFPKLRTPRAIGALHDIIAKGQEMPGYAWFSCKADVQNRINSPMTKYYEQSILTGENRRGSDELQLLWTQITGSQGGSAREHWYPQVYSSYFQAVLPRPSIEYIPTLRRIPLRLEEFEDEYGAITAGDSIIDELAALAQPAYTKSDDRIKFDRLQDFVRQVLKRPSIKISVPHDKKTINVDDFDRHLPIEALGTGIHQVILLAATALLKENTVILIEEPELHLHPELQQQLMHFLVESTTNQYFVTTHSATIMDSVDAAVFSVRLHEGNSVVDTPLGRGDRRAICHRLGYRPSDLLQANSLIWVEGPSDRVYLLKWLRQMAPGLEKGGISPSCSMEGAC